MVGGFVDVMYMYNFEMWECVVVFIFDVVCFFIENELFLLENFISIG